MSLRTIALTAGSLLLLAGCGAAATPPTATQAAYPFACSALKLGSQGQWAEAQHRWLSAEQNTTDGGAVAAFLVMNLDTAMLAADQFSGMPKASHLATYQSDLSGDGAYTAGC